MFKDCFSSIVIYTVLPFPAYNLDTYNFIPNIKASIYAVSFKKSESKLLPKLLGLPGDLIASSFGKAIQLGSGPDRPFR
jgi:hypothetical protein